MTGTRLDRRTFLQLTASGLALGPFLCATAASANIQPIKKAIPKTQEPLAIIGMGTWQTFNVGSDKQLRDQRSKVLKAFFELGGQMIDSSPMYGSSQAVVGYALEKLGRPKALFAADKIWTNDGDATQKQLAEIEAQWKIDTFDVMQIHNLLAWREHIATLQDLKQQGKIRYLGITTSHGRRHKDMEHIMLNNELDFVQLTYHINNREVENRLLPIAKERNIAVIANRPFEGGALLNRLQSSKAKLPTWAREFQINNWPQYLLKFVCSHPAITCAIPATSQVVHMQENMGAGVGVLPDEKARQKMLAYLKTI